MSLENLIKTMMQEFRQIVKTETVVGEPVVVEDTVVVPVSKISFGFGAGGGKGDKADGGSGTGGGGSVEPVAFIVIHKGKAQILPLKESGMPIGKLLELAPEVLKKIRDFREKREKKRAEKEAGEKPEEEESKSEEKE